MFSRGSKARGLPSGGAQAGWCAVVALFFTLAGDRLVGIERGFYDLGQRWSAPVATVPVTIVDPGGSGDDPWRQPGFAELLVRLRTAGARVVLPASLPPVGLDGNQQQALASGLQSAGNVVIGVAVSGRRTDAQGPPGACGERVAAASAAYAESRNDRPPTETLIGTYPALCESAAALGYLAPPLEKDGVVRETAPILLTGLGSLPPAALAAFQLAGDAGRAAGRDPGDLIRYYATVGGRTAFPAMSAGDVLAGRTGGLRDRYVVIGKPAADPGAGFVTPVNANMSAAELVATQLGNYLGDQGLNRPAWAPLAEILLALCLGVAAMITGRLAPPVAAALAIGAALALLLLEYALLARAGIWLQLAGLALFCLTGVALLQFLVAIFGRPGSSTGSAGLRRAASAAGAGEELDLGFSVLRQQPTTDKTKQQLYALAMEHGRNRDYARAERVFRHLAARDPGYRDVAAKLEKLSGARGEPAPRKAATPSDPAGASVPAAVRTLGRYELERVIGRGAMATVYLGRDPTINRRVAIKTLPLAEEFAEGDLATARSHFLREAESAGRLNHPYIIAIHDAGEDHHVAYLAMEYFEGKPLSYYARVGQLLPPRVVFELMARAAEALHYAHTQNVVHRDVKPANLLYDATTDRLKLTDFGIARLTDASRTRTGIILGTPSYMSPEQLSASKVTGQTDLYSLGVTMYHLLAGSPPFQADSIPKLMDKIVHHEHRPLGDIRDDIPPCIDSILRRALAKAPEDRFPDGKSMALALRECCSTFPVDPS